MLNLKREKIAFIWFAKMLYLMEIIRQLNLPPHLTQELISSLLARNLLVELDEYGQHAYLPARNLDTIRVNDVIRAVQGNQTLSSGSKEDSLILAMITASENRFEELSGNKNIREILDELEQLDQQNPD